MIIVAKIFIVIFGILSVGAIVSGFCMIKEAWNENKVIVAAGIVVILLGVFLGCITNNILELLIAG